MHTVQVALLKSPGVCRNIREGPGRRHTMTFYLYKDEGSGSWIARVLVLWVADREREAYCRWEQMLNHPRGVSSFVVVSGEPCRLSGLLARSCSILHRFGSPHFYRIATTHTPHRAPQTHHTERHTHTTQSTTHITQSTTHITHITQSTTHCKADLDGLLQFTYTTSSEFCVSCVCFT